MCGNFSLNVSFMSFLRSEGLTYSMTVVCGRRQTVWLVSGSPAAALSMRSQAVSGHRSLGSCFTVLQHTTTRHQSSTFSGGKEGACLVFSFQVALSRMDYTVKLLIRIYIQLLWCNRIRPMVWWHYVFSRSRNIKIICDGTHQ